MLVPAFAAGLALLTLLFLQVQHSLIQLEAREPEPDASHPPEQAPHAQVPE